MEEGRTSSLPFANQAAIVTGGGQGLGEAIAKMLVEDGCAVMIFDVDEAKAKTVTDTLRANGHKVEWCRVDVADEGSVSTGFEVMHKEQHNTKDPLPIPPCSIIHDDTYCIDK